MPAFYNDGVRRRRIPRERERWLSAVLIVTAIAGVSAAVRFWPLSLPPSGPRALASRALLAIDAPVLPMSGRVLLEPPEPGEPMSPPPPPPPVELPGVVVADVAPATAEASVESIVADLPPSAGPLLAGRRLEMPWEPPAMSPRVDPRTATADDESHALNELPAVAMTRVVTVAGRGIRTGVRATTAVFRAAF
jgi:hypothetical protein